MLTGYGGEKFGSMGAAMVTGGTGMDSLTLGPRESDNYSWLPHVIKAYTIIDAGNKKELKKKKVDAINL